MKKIGVILARLQPIHNGHLALIEKSINENDETYVFIGSANKFNKRNPLPISLRLMLCKEAFKEKFDWDENTNIVKSKEGKNLHIVQLDDLTSESDNSYEWGFYLYSKIVTETQCSNFTIYYSDGFEIITTWFPSHIPRNNISLSLLARGATENGLSATQIRDTILGKTNLDLKSSVPSVVYAYKDTIKNHIELANLIEN